MSRNVRSTCSIPHAKELVTIEEVGRFHMHHFSSKLDDGREFSGLYSFPDKLMHFEKGRPLLVALHGMSYGAEYFDADEKHSIEVASHVLGLPVIAINRPACSDHIPVVGNLDDTFIQHQGNYIHEHVLPALWKDYGPIAQATSIVLYGHSSGAAISILIAALHAQSTQTANYPLAGLVTCSVGRIRDLPLKSMLDMEGGHVRVDLDDKGQPDSFSWDVDYKDELMLCPELGLQSPNMTHSGRLNRNIHMAEIVDLCTLWPTYWEERYARHVVVPHLHAVPEFDKINDVGQIDEFALAFTNCQFVESCVLDDAPYSVELSWQSQAWFTKVFGFSMQCAVGYELEKNFQKVYLMRTVF